MRQVSSVKKWEWNENPCRFKKPGHSSVICSFPAPMIPIVDTTQQNENKYYISIKLVFYGAFYMEKSVCSITFIGKNNSKLPFDDFEIESGHKGLTEREYYFPISSFDQD